MRRPFGVLPLGLAIWSAAPARAQVDWERKIVLPPLTGHAMATDTVRGRVVLFGGGYSGSAAIDDTWEWDGSTWTYRSVATRPSPRSGPAMAFDSVRGRTVLFGGRSRTGILADTWEWDGTAWTQLAPGASPPPRQGHGMVFDSARNRIVLFGGYSGSAGIYLSDTWEWDGATWTQVFPAQSPSPRETPLAFDAARSRTVLFGGTSSNGTFMGDTWEWDGTNWLQRTPTQAPFARHARAMAFDPQRSRVVLCSGGGSGLPGADTWEWDGTNWTLRNTNQVMRRGSQQMAYDPVQQRLIMYGGSFSDGGPRVPFAVQACSDTQAWNGTNWVQVDGHTSPPRRPNQLTFDPVAGRVLQVTAEGSYATAMLTWHWVGDRWVQRQPVMSPSERQFSSLAADPVRQRVVLFGGAIPTSSLPPLNETWEWDGTTWLQRTPAQRPTPRAWAAMAFCANNSKLVLFGGYDPNVNTYGDTWEWDGSNWSQRNPAQSPAARREHVMAGDRRRGVVVLFGGYTGNNTLGDTWEWDGSNWLQRSPAQSPPARVEAAMTYDAARQRIVLDGGNTNGSGALSDTWEWDGTNWTQRAPATRPPTRVGHAIAFDEGTGHVVLYGGGEAVTWEYGPRTPATFTSYGNGCTGSAGTPTLAAADLSLPWIGDTLTLRLTNLPATAPGTMLVGESNTAWGNVGLPFDLGFLGMPGCPLLTPPTLLVPVTASSGVATLGLPIPNVQGFVGGRFYCQGLVLDLPANALGVTASNGGASRIGGR